MARPSGVRYREALDALRTIHLALQQVLEARLTAAVRIQIETLVQMVERLLSRDNGRSR